MNNSNRFVAMTLLGLFVLVATAFQVSPAAAQAIIVNQVNTHRTFYDETVTVQTGDEGALAGLVIEVVPDDQHLVLTDVVMTHNVNTTSTLFRANIRRGPSTNVTACEIAGLVLGPYVNPGETVSVNLSTGIEFGPGEQLCVVVGGAGAGEGLTITFTGYFANPATGP